MKRVPAVTSKQILELSRHKVAPNTKIRTDGWHAYCALASNGFVHESHVVSKVKEAFEQPRWVYLLTANREGNIRGVRHGVSEKHLDRYLAEFSYRFNRQYWDSQLFNRTVVACVSTLTVTFAELRA